MWACWRLAKTYKSRIIRGDKRLNHDALGKWKSRQQARVYVLMGDDESVEKQKKLVGLVPGTTLHEVLAAAGISCVVG